MHSFAECSIIAAIKGAKSGKLLSQKEECCTMHIAFVAAAAAPQDLQ
jgi:hypothetical protein